jgi:phosphoheptose isomerase
MDRVETTASCLASDLTRRWNQRRDYPDGCVMKNRVKDICVHFDADFRKQYDKQISVLAKIGERRSQLDA